MIQVHTNTNLYCILGVHSLSLKFEDYISKTIHSFPLHFQKDYSKEKRRKKKSFLYNLFKLNQYFLNQNFLNH